MAKISVLKRKVSVIIFYNTQGKILLQGRSGEVSKSGEEWGFFGGSIDEGETPEQAIIREVKEELNYDLEEFTKIGEYDNQYFNQKQKNHGKIYRMIFVSPLNDRIIDSKVIEGDESKLFTTKDAKELKLIPGDEKVIEIFENYLKKTKPTKSDIIKPRKLIK